MKFVHTQKRLSRYFSKVLAYGGDRLKPLLIVAKYGAGRSTYITAAIRSIECSHYIPFKDIDSDVIECDCDVCKKITDGITQDLWTFTPNMPISEFRDILSRFVTTRPMDLKFKYIVFKNSDLATAGFLDVFLKIAEEPYKYLKIFVTAEKGGSGTALSSRLHVIEFSNLTPVNLKSIIFCNGRLKPLERWLSYYRFQSIGEVELFARYSIHDTVWQLLNCRGNPYKVELALNALFSKTDSDGGSGLRVADLLIMYVYHVLMVKFEHDISVRQMLSRVLIHMDFTYFKYRDASNWTYSMRLNNQLGGLFTVLSGIYLDLSHD